MATRRWIKSVIRTAAATRVAYPWERSRRAHLLARRKLDSAKAKLAGT